MIPRGQNGALALTRQAPAGAGGAAWTPGTANLNAVASFEVVGLPPGSSSESWNFPRSNSRTCWTSITARPEQTRSAVVTVTHLATGEQRTLGGTAEYTNGWD